MKVICSLLLFVPCLSALMTSCYEYFLINVKQRISGTQIHLKYYSHSLPLRSTLTVLYRKYVSDYLVCLHYPQSRGYLMYRCRWVAEVPADSSNNFIQTICIILENNLYFNSTMDRNSKITN